MALLYPIMLNTAINVGIFSSVFIKMMTETMADRDEWDNKERTSKALLCMLGLGVGEIVGSLAFGRLMDKCSIRLMVLANCLAVTIAYGFLILYGAHY